MAIDSAEKRRSVAGVSFWLFGPSVTPNASKDVEWRQQVGYGYSGIEPSGAVIDDAEYRTGGGRIDFEWVPDEVSYPYGVHMRTN